MSSAAASSHTRTTSRSPSWGFPASSSNATEPSPRRWLRRFLALLVPDDVHADLAAWGRRHLERGRRVEAFHVTLAFLGSRPRAELAAIARALRESTAACAQFSLEPLRYRETRSVGMLV